MTDYKAMSGPELVAVYNAMCALPVVAANLEERRCKPVQKFTDNATGIARCEALASQIRAWSSVAEQPKTTRKKRELKAPKIGAAPVTLRSQVVAVLEANKGAWVEGDALLLAAYGKADKGQRGGLSNILRGVKKDITGASYELLSEKGKRFGFFNKTS